MKKLNKKGFTLIEMLVVVAIIAILVAIIVPTISTATKKSQGATDAANLRSVTAKAAADYLDNQQLDDTYTIDSKLLDGEKTITFYIDDNDDLVGAVEGGYLLKDFEKVAEDGSDISASGVSGLTAAKVASSG